MITREIPFSRINANMSNTVTKKGRNGLPANDLWSIVSGDASDCRAFLKKITSVPPP